MFKTALFWQFFASYFILFIIPVIMANMFIYVYVVKVIENEVENTNTISMRNFSAQTDTAFSSLQVNMINLLGASNLKSVMKQFGDASKTPQYFEWIHSLMDQLNTLDTGEIVSNAYLYFADYDLVIGFNSDTNKETFFKYFFPVDERDKAGYLANFSGKKMMQFTKTYTLHQKVPFTDAILSSSSNISAVMSYPFNSSHPDVYLVVSMKQEELGKHISVNQKWTAGTAIVDESGGMISQTGDMRISPKEWQEIMRANTEGALFSDGKTRALTYAKSHFNDAWYYVSLIDLETLLKPVQRIRSFSFLFLVFFLVLGGFISYYLSKRLYRPILEIKNGLSSHNNRQAALPVQAGGNDYDLIKQFSNLLMSENKQLSQLVSGMFPIVQEDFIAKILSGEYRDNLSIALYAKEIDFPYDPSVTRTVLCIEIQYYSRVQGHISETSKSFMMAELKEQIHKSAAGTVWLCQLKPDLMACVVHHDPFLLFGPKEVSEFVALILQQFNAYFKATIGIGRKVQDIGDLHLSYESAMEMLQRKSLHSRVEVFGQEAAAGDQPDKPLLDSFLSAQEVNRIFNLYKSRNYERLLQSVYDLLDMAVENNASASQVKGLCSDVLNTWIRAVELERKEMNIPFYSGLFVELNRCITWEEIKTCFERIHAALFKQEQTADRNKQIAEILDYIHQHYGEELSVERFARQLNMSVSHFSRTFKDEVGEKYVEYITKHRLTMAKKYLLETDMKIDEISEKVGYMGRNSFIRIFCKYEGITPGKYRTIHHHTM
ncbi:helix-turn-helix domain-containing protein [Paenibacillus thalictri]|nr:helix-turn-helix domain-containing protein [Paenibacillus thalictri]